MAFEKLKRCLGLLSVEVYVLGVNDQGVEDLEVFINNRRAVSYPSQRGFDYGGVWVDTGAPVPDWLWSGPVKYERRRMRIAAIETARSEGGE